MVKSSRAEDADPGSHFQGGEEEEKSPCRYNNPERFEILDCFPTVTLRFSAYSHKKYLFTIEKI